MANFIVSARKYRPSRFEDVLGQEHISRTLKMALATGKIAQSFLFTGPRGVGKTTCARILAKAMNCTNLTADFEPCGECASCTAFNENASFSIFELDAASNNSVDSIRSLIDQVRFPPQTGRYKIFIIDEVHMLSTQAFNAFLKTLEEPPSYVVFILATTEKHKIIPTILSRCQIFDFKRITIRDIVKQLHLISEREEIKASDDALHLIASKSDGAMRDALSIFDRIAGAYSNQVTYKDVVDNLNILDYTYFFRIVDFMGARELGACMLIIDECIKAGFDPEIILGGLAEHFRQLLMCKDPVTLTLVEYADAVVQKYHDQALMIPTDYLLACLDICNECELNFKTARNKRLHLEMAMIKMIYLRDIEVITREKFVEKKTPDLTDLSVNAEKKYAENISVEKQEVSIIDQNLLDSDKIKKVLEREKHIVNQGSDVPKKSKKKSIGLDDFETKAKEAVQSITSVNIDAELLQKLWFNYAQNQASQTVRIIMQENPVTFDSEIIYLQVGGTFDQNVMINETELLDYIRKEIKSSKVRLQVDIDPELARQKQILTPKTSQENYDSLVKKNPYIKDLFNDLGLKLED